MTRTGKVPTLTTWVGVDHVTTKGKLTLGWDNIPDSAPTESAYYVHLFWTFFHLFLMKLFDLF
jgi:hypothetical protein